VFILLALEPEEHTEVAEQKNQTGEVDTADIFLLIFHPEKHWILSTSFVNIAFPYSLLAGLRASLHKR
jgi:hypothetical protein